MTLFVVKYMDESCHIRMSHVTCGWVMSPRCAHVDDAVCGKMHLWVTSHQDESCLLGVRNGMTRFGKNTWISHVTCGWVMSHVDESCHMWKSHVTCGESCHMWMSHVTKVYTRRLHFYMYDSCHKEMSRVTCERVMSHMKELCNIWISHVSYKWVMSHMSHINESCHTCLIWLFHTWWYVAYKRVV